MYDAFQLPRFLPLPLSPPISTAGLAHAGAVTPVPAPSPRQLNFCHGWIHHPFPFLLSSHLRGWVPPCSGKGRDSLEWAGRKGKGKDWFGYGDIDIDIRAGSRENRDESGNKGLYNPSYNPKPGPNFLGTLSGPKGPGSQVHIEAGSGGKDLGRNCIKHAGYT